MTTPEARPPGGNFIILTPVFNDWQSLGLLLKEVDRALGRESLSAEVLVVDDASTVPLDGAALDLGALAAIERVRVLELTRNFGHQRAIALGLAYIEANMECRAAVVMDADGEDSPADVPRLIAKCAEGGYRRVVFALRARRNEGRVFRGFYVLYRWLYKLLTGHTMRVGNFSVVPGALLRRLVCVSEIWNHYAVGVMKAKIPTAEISTERGRRLAGRSRMNFVSLVVHGLSAISVYGDIIGVRLLISTLALMGLAVLGIGVTFAIRFGTTLAIPGWATYMSVGLGVIAMQALVLSLFFIFIILSSRNATSFLPMRDYSPFVHRLLTIYPAHD